MAEENAASTEEQQPQFMIQKIYTKDLSFETPNSPSIFREEWKPELDLQLSNEYNKMEDNNHEVTLILTVTAKLGEKTAFLIEVKQAGIFTMIGHPDEQMGPLVGSYCPNILFPFAREVVSDLVQKGGFPQIVLAPVNFDALYMSQMQRAQQAAQEQQKH